MSGVVRSLVVVSALAAVFALPASAHPPTLSAVPSDMTVEAQSRFGATVSYTAPTATHGGTSVTVTCTPAPGAVFVLGTTKVNCSAEDPDSHEKATGSFQVTVVDTLPPSVTGGDDVTVEATGPDGAIVAYTLPVATDLVDGARPVTCTPAPGSRFHLGDTTVQCSAADTLGHKTTGSFKVSVVDTTPPEFEDVPEDTVQDVNGRGPYALEYVPPTATDLLDGRRGVFCNPKVGRLVPLGSTTVLCTTVDSRGNRGSVAFSITMSDTTAPPALARLQIATAGSAVTLSWVLPDDKDVKGIEVVRTPGKSGAAKTVVYRGRAQAFVDRGLAKNLSYRYTATTFDYAGNVSKPIAVVATFKATGILGPPDGARLTSLPLLRWNAVPKASYYNIQLYRGSAKILSIWPTRTALQLKPTWTYLGREYRLTPGTYRWYVWPGFGALRLARYGPLIGQSSFVLLAAPG